MPKQKYWRLILVAPLVAILLGSFVIGVKKNMDDQYFNGNDKKLQPAILADDGAAITEALSQMISLQLTPRFIHTRRKCGTFFTTMELSCNR